MGIWPTAAQIRAARLKKIKEEIDNADVEAVREVMAENISEAPKPVDNKKVKKQNRKG